LVKELRAAGYRLSAETEIPILLWPGLAAGLGLPPVYDCLYADRHSCGEEKDHGISIVSKET